ncbi:MAG: DUF3306 domain-containing protein, partial [Pseudomonadota bacterium]
QDVADDELEANRLAAESVDLESLGPDSDLSVFLRRGVPDLLKNQALKAVWRSDPVFANLDELIDYGEDYGAKSLVMETFTSAWQAGRGYVQEAEEAIEKLEEVVGEEEPEVLSAEVSEPEEPETVVEIEVAEAELEPDDTPTVSLRHRMGV